MHHLDERPEGDPVAVGEAASLRDRGAENARRELLREPRLSDAGGAEHGHEPARLLLERQPIDVVEDALLGLPADERRAEPPEDAVGARPDLVEAPGVHVFTLALEGERPERAGADPVLDEPVGLLSEQDLAGLRRLLQARGDVERVTAGDRLPRGGVADDDLARVDPHSRPEPHAPAGLELAVQAPERVAHLAGRPDCAQGVVLVQHRHAEHAQHRVADELLDRPAVPLQDRAHLVEVAQHHVPHRLRIDALAQVRRARDIAEEDGDGLTGERLRPLGHVPSLGPEAVKA